MLNLKISHKFTGISLFTLFALSVTGCGVITVDYKHDLQLPESYAGIRNAENNIQDLSKWWEGFNDPLLTELINKALKQNYNIRTAGLTLEKALHEANLAKADLGPSAAQSSRYKLRQSWYGRRNRGKLGTGFIREKAKQSRCCEIPRVIDP